LFVKSYKDVMGNLSTNSEDEDDEENGEEEKR
jgi:hypothetical protein